MGKRLTGHFRTLITARCPVENIPDWDRTKLRTLQLAASYAAGKDSSTGQQYHVSVTAIHSPNPENDADDAGRECPDSSATAAYAQLKGSEKYVVFGKSPTMGLPRRASHTRI